jgi:hypothetical protein
MAPLFIIAKAVATAKEVAVVSTAPILDHINYNCIPLTKQFLLIIQVQIWIIVE